MRAFRVSHAGRCDWYPFSPFIRTSFDLYLTNIERTQKLWSANERCSFMFVCNFNAGKYKYSEISLKAFEFTESNLRHFDIFSWFALELLNFEFRESAEVWFSHKNVKNTSNSTLEWILYRAYAVYDIGPRLYLQKRTQNVTSYASICSIIYI